MENTVSKKALKVSRSNAPKRFPSNIGDYFANRPEHHANAKKALRWLHKLIGRNFCGCTAIGKYYDTLILDITYQGSEVYIDGSKIIVNRTEVNTYKEFETAVKQEFDIVND
jgi:hypothetical protein